MKGDYRVGELTTGNHDEVRQLVLAGLAEHWGELDPRLNPDLDDMLSAYGHGRTAVVSDRSGRIVGTGTIVPHDAEVAEIVRMSVSLAARRHGVGRRIVEELIARANEWGVERIVLETTSTWTEVVAFYLSCGFTVTHTDHDEFGDNTWFVRELA